MVCPMSGEHNQGKSTLETAVGCARMPHVVDVAMLKGEDMTRSIDFQKPPIGSIGVMLDDASPAPTLWEFMGMFSSFIGRYRSLIDGSECHRDIDQFWTLLDSLP